MVSLFQGCIVAVTLLAAPVAAAEGPLVLERKIPLGEVAGRIDHLAVDVPGQRLFVAELGNDSVGVVDLASGRVAHRIAGLREPQGVAYLPDPGVLYVATAADGMLHRFAGAGFARLGSLALGDDADNIRVDRDGRVVIVGYGGGALGVIDPRSGAKTGEMHLSAHPESFQLDPDGARIYVNVPNAGRRNIAVLDRAAGRQTAGWGLADAGGNFPMALDPDRGRLLVVYRKPPVLAVLATADGRLIARLATCGDADDIFFDEKRQRAYVSCGEGAIDIVERQGDAYQELTRLSTPPGARTSLFVPAFDRLYLAVRASGKEPAALWVFRPQ
jgi:DNA-binding beta-propeller fold protein YncE